MTFHIFRLCLLGMVAVTAVNTFLAEPHRNNYTDILLRYLKKPKICSCSVNEPYTSGLVCGGDQFVDYMDATERYLHGMCDLVDKTRCVKESRMRVFDYIVVGSGAGGAVVAARLAEARQNVLLLEAGGPAPTPTQIPGMYFTYDMSPIDWNFALEKNDNACLSQDGVCYWPRGKVMGGTTILHGMMYMRGYPQDYDNLRLEGWNWESVLKYFLLSEDNRNIGTYADEGLHGTGGILTVQRFPDHPQLAEDILKGAAQLGYPSGVDLNGKVRHGYTMAQATCRNGARLSTTKAYIYENPKRIYPNRLKVTNKALVHRILIDNENKAYGVEYEKDDEFIQVFAKKEVIISAGTVQSPQLLMLSGVGPRENLEKHNVIVRKDLPGVGQNLKNHASFSVVYTVKNELGTNTLNTETFKEFTENRTGPLTSTGLSQLTGFLNSSTVLKSDEFYDTPDIQMFFAGYLANCSATGSTKEQAIPGYQRRVISMTPTLLRPKSVGHLELKSQYMSTPPKIEANLLKVEHDLDVILAGIRHAQKLANTPALRDLIELDRTEIDACKQHEFDSDAYWKCAMRWFTNPENHQVGTCKMGNDDDEMAVTDARLRVRGIKNLRVVDASVFPNVPSGNLNAPTIMVGEKAADMIREDWGLPTML